MAAEIQAQAEALLRAEVSKNGVGHRLDLAMLLLDKGTPADAKEALELAGADVTNRKSATSLNVAGARLCRHKPIR